MTNNKPCRKDLLQWINVVSFAVDDVQLFLDTHRKMRRLWRISTNMTNYANRHSKNMPCITVL